MCCTEQQRIHTRTHRSILCMHLIYFFRLDSYHIECIFTYPAGNDDSNLDWIRIEHLSTKSFFFWCSNKVSFYWLISSKQQYFLLQQNPPFPTHSTRPSRKNRYMVLLLYSTSIVINGYIAVKRLWNPFFFLRFLFSFHLLVASPFPIVRKVAAT